MTEARIACVHSGSDKAARRFQDLTGLYDFVKPEESDVILALGGDGLMLHTVHNYLHLRKPIFGMNCGTVGFLMNDYRTNDLVNRIETAKHIDLFPLVMKAGMHDGQVTEALAFNEVAITRHSGQSANLRVLVDGKERVEKFVGDGIIVATASGSTAYNYSAHGPIIPLGSKLLALTPVSPFRPRRWKGALLPDNIQVRIENLDTGKRPLAVTADFREFFNLDYVDIRQDAGQKMTLLFDPDHSLEERIVAEQFMF